MPGEQPEATVFAYSVKLETTAKGLIQPTVHVYSNDPDHVRNAAIALFKKTIADLKTEGFKPATEGGA